MGPLVLKKCDIRLRTLGIGLTGKIDVMSHLTSDALLPQVCRVDILLNIFLLPPSILGFLLSKSGMSKASCDPLLQGRYQSVVKGDSLNLCAAASGQKADVLVESTLTQLHLRPSLHTLGLWCSSVTNANVATAHVGIVATHIRTAGNYGSEVFWSCK